MSRITRRQLGPAVAAALAAPAVPAPDEKPKEPREAAADALLEVVKLRYGKQLDAAKLKAVRGSLVTNWPAERLRRAATGGEPAFAFGGVAVRRPSVLIPPATLYLTIPELGERLRKRDFSSEELTRAYLDRLEDVGPKLGAVVTVMREQALKEAKQADAELKARKDRGPLHGIPYGAKDLLATNGVPTTWGAEPFRKQVFDHDATVVTKLRNAGAVLIAKLAMVELAGGFGYNRADASFTGPCKTPWNLDYWSGGSSSGSGAAVAAGLVAFAIGSETSGSIITPASFCGISGLRPTYGRVSRHGAMALSWTLDKVGPMGRAAEDCGLVLAAIAGRDPLDPSTAARVFRYPQAKEKTRFRIGIVAGAADRVQPEVKKNFEATLKVLAGFAELVDGVKLPEMPFGDVLGTVLRAEEASAFRDLLDSGDIWRLRTARDKAAAHATALVLATDYLQAMRARGPMKKAMHELYIKYDAVLAPGRPTVAYPIDRDFGKAYPEKVSGPASGSLIVSCNVVGLPALCLPNGLGENGLPTSVQLTGRAWSEARLVAIGQAYQKATDWHRKRPPGM
ncbi:MAG: amidase [Gemmataceae bacterium]